LAGLVLYPEPTEEVLGSSQLVGRQGRLSRQDHYHVPDHTVVGLFCTLCSEAEARGKRIIRDYRISTFMDRIGKGFVNGRVCIVLSDKYLKSSYCMHELFDVWRNCLEDPDTLIDRTRVLVLPSAKISTAVERAQSVIHWQSAFKALDALVREHNSCCPTRTTPSSGS
jgi:hypothetical protein